MLFEPLFQFAESNPQRVAITDDRGAVTYAQLATMAAGLGMLLQMQTQAPRVGILLPASAGFVASFYGTLLAGKAAVPINFLLGDKEIAHIIRDSGIDTILTAPPLMGRLKDAPVKLIDLTQLPTPQPGAYKPAFPKVNPSDLALLLYTSGTSGLPKGVLLTYENLHSDVSASIQRAELKQEHKFLGVIPLFHSFGITAMMIAPIMLGASIVYIARFSAVAAVKAIREHAASLTFGTPSMFAAIARLKDASPEDFKSIYAIITGGEPLPAALREGFEQRFKTKLFEGYGLTETSSIISFNIPHLQRPGSVGKPIPGAKVKVVDDDGKPLPVGQIGELLYAGPMIMQGYHNLPADSAEAFDPEGYFRSGDLGKVDQDGFLYITGRKKEMIIVAGEKAYPREIEDTLLAQGQVAEAAVVAKKDPMRGEVIAAFVIPKEGQALRADELRDFCRSHGLAQWKVPREVYIVSDFPRSPTGKVLRRELAEQLASGTLKES